MAHIVNTIIKVEIDSNSNFNQLSQKAININSNMTSKTGNNLLVTPPTKMGSRRIFTPQFKLQVLDSYRNDTDCKGNQRATARKYGIHRRQIQKWLQCEGNLRSSVVNGSGNNKGSNINNNSIEKNNKLIIDVPKVTAVTQQYSPVINKASSGFISPVLSYTSEPSIPYHTYSHYNTEFSSVSLPNSPVPPVLTTATPTYTTPKSSVIINHRCDNNLSSSSIASTSSCYNNSNINNNNLSTGASNDYINLNYENNNNNIYPTQYYDYDYYEYSRVASSPTSTAITISTHPIDLSTNRSRLDDKTINSNCDETKSNGGGDWKNNNYYKTITDLSSNCKNEAVDLTCRKRKFSNSFDNNNQDNNQSSPPKTIKLFKPYLLDGDDKEDNTDINNKVKSTTSINNDNKNSADEKKSKINDQCDPIIWSNHPSCSPTDYETTNIYTHKYNFFGSPTSHHNYEIKTYWCPQGSPVSGYDSAASVSSVFSDISEHYYPQTKLNNIFDYNHHHLNYQSTTTHSYRHHQHSVQKWLQHDDHLSSQRLIITN